MSTLNSIQPSKPIHGFLKVLIITLLFLLPCAFSVHAQDVITLKNGDEIKAKVTEMTSSEIKYKRFDNLDGPTVVVAKTEVFTINYENGTREVINTVAADAPAERKADYTTWKGPHKKNFYTGVYLDPVGFLIIGPRVGVELTFVRHVIVDAYVRFPSVGLLSGIVWEGTTDVDNFSGIGVGFSAKYFTGGRKGGFYVGPAAEYWTADYDYESNRHWKGSGIAVGVNLGYKFQFASGFYLRTGGMLGGSITTSGTYTAPDGISSEDLDYDGVFYLLDFCLGFSF